MQVWNVRDDSEAPDGWTKWGIPGYEYIYVERENEDTFSEVIKYLEEHDIFIGRGCPRFYLSADWKGISVFPN